MFENTKAEFSLPDNEIFLNCAYMSPLLKCVEEAGMKGIMKKRNPASISVDDFFEDSALLRREFGRLIGADNPNRIVTIPSVSYAISTVANNIPLKPKNNIVVAAQQFPSNYYPWEKICSHGQAILKVVSPEEGSDRGKSWNENLLEAIDSNTKVVALGHIHWADGTLFDLKAIREKSREVGAVLIIDGTQSVGALPFDVKEIQPDALICASYKWLLGPYSIGAAYFGPYFDNGSPLEENWINRENSENFSGLVNYRSGYQPGSLRYEVGEHSNFVLLPMMLEAIKKLNEWGVSNIQEHCHNISKDALLRLEGSKFYTEQAEFRAAHMFGIKCKEELDSELLSKKLKENQISVSMRGNAIRIAPHVYNTKADIETLIDLLLEF